MAGTGLLRPHVIHLDEDVLVQWIGAHGRQVDVDRPVPVGVVPVDLPDVEQCIAVGVLTTGHIAARGGQAVDAVVGSELCAPELGIRRCRASDSGSHQRESRRESQRDADGLDMCSAGHAVLLSCTNVRNVAARAREDIARTPRLSACARLNRAH